MMFHCPTCMDKMHPKFSRSHAAICLALSSTLQQDLEQWIADALAGS